MKIILFLILTITINSCGVFLYKERKAINVDSYPQGAEIYLNDTLVGVTPAKLDLRGYQNQLVLELKKDNYVNDKLIIVSEDQVTQKYSDMVFYILPYLLTARIDYDYTSFKMKDNFIELRKKDSLIQSNTTITPIFKNTFEQYYDTVTNFKSEYNNNRLFNSSAIVELNPILPFVFFTFSAYHYFDIYDFNKENDSKYSIGLRSGITINSIDLTVFDRSKSTTQRTDGFYSLPSISYEKTNNNMQTFKHIFSIGPSYSYTKLGTLIERTRHYDKQFDYTKSEDLLYTIMYSYQVKNYNSNIVASTTIGYLDKLFFFQVGFGWFIY